jgi:hypothetical protein
LINRGCSKAFQTYDFFGSFETSFAASGFPRFSPLKVLKNPLFSAVLSGFVRETNGFADPGGNFSDEI